MDINEYVLTRATQAKEASRKLACLSSEQKDKMLTHMATALRQNADYLIKENAKDIEYAKSKGLASALIDRLLLNEKRIEEMAQGLEDIVKLPDPVGEMYDMRTRPNGMIVGRMRVPIGVIAIIYEARPNVTADAAGLCLKSGNAVILRGGSEALHSNKAIVTLLKASAKANNVPEDAITFIDITDREAVTAMLKLEGIIDLVIPRGGEGLIRTVVQNSQIPVLKHYKGVCHVYVDRDADLQMAEEICFNAKVQRPGTCNAMETLLVDAQVAEVFLPKIISRFQTAGVKLKGCPQVCRMFKDIEPVQEQDYYSEYLALICNVKIVSDIDEAIAHIAKYGSAHTDSIVTNNYQKAMKFLKQVDSSATMINASTRLNDGFQFGLGAEIGIATDKLHARGPMGLVELTCSKFVVFGSGQLRK